jgi:hypothetical protein
MDCSTVEVAGKGPICPLFDNESVGGMLAWAGGADRGPARGGTKADAQRGVSAARVAAGAAGVGIGLSPTHISPGRKDGSLTVKISYSVGGSLLQLKGPGVGTFRRKSSMGVWLKGGGSEGKRKEIGGFSPASRLRLLKWLQSINRDKVKFQPIFGTLTYGREFPTDGETIKRHIDNFGKAFRRRYPESCFIWKLEAQERGAPHFHLLILNQGYVSHKWIAATWNRIVGGDKLHLKAGTEVRRVRSWGGVISYASKYIGKAGGTELTGVGRHWGIVGRENLPVELETFIASLDDGYRLRRAMARYRNSQQRGKPQHKRRWSPRGVGQRYAGAFCFMPDAEARRLVAGVASSARPEGWKGDEGDDGTRAGESWDVAAGPGQVFGRGSVGTLLRLRARISRIRDGQAHQVEG